MRFLPRWRKASWAIAIWTALMFAWIIAGSASVSNNCDGLTGTDLSACQAGTAIGGGVAITMLIALWFVGFIVLSLVWLMSRPSRRTCPRCGNEVKRGLTVCPSCQYEFGVQPTTADS